jgi:ribose transport system substrate-binding protein
MEMRKIIQATVFYLTAAICLSLAGPSARAADKLTVGISFQQLSDPFFISIIYGCQKAALEEDINLIIHEAGGYANVDRQIQQIEDLIQKKVNMMIIMPTNAKGVVPVVERAIASGIPAMHMGSQVASDKMISFVQADDHELGAAQARFLISILKGKGNVLYIAGPAGVTWTVDRLAGFKSVLEKSPDLKLLDQLWINSSREAGLRNTEDKLETYKDLNAISSGADVMTQGSGDAVKAANKVGKVLLTTAGLSKDTEDMIRNGVIQMTAAQQTVLMGYNAVKTAVKYLRKQPYEKNTKIAPIVVTKENIANLSLETIRAPDSFKPKLMYP